MAHLLHGHAGSPLARVGSPLTRTGTPMGVFEESSSHVSSGMPHYHLVGKDLKMFSEAGFHMDKIHIKRNAPVAQLYEDAIRNEGAIISASGALINFSGKKTGRSPKDKRIVYEETSKDHVWWGSVNIKMDEHTFEINRERAIDYLNTRDNVYVFDGYAGWDPKYRIKVRVICARAYHALFMHNMLIRPSEAELDDFGDPDFTIYNAGQFPANRFTSGMTSATSVEINFKRREMVILGTEYAGEMKKGIFSVMHYLQPVKFGQLSLHSSANEGPNGDVSLFFGLSGTGKTTLSADPARMLIGDDEHVWAFSTLKADATPSVWFERRKRADIFRAIRFGAILENVVYDGDSREPCYDDSSITENTRCAYPIEFIPNAKIPCLSTAQPSNVVYLTCDAYGILPPVSRLTRAQAQYWFLMGYTSKTPGTEDGTHPDVFHLFWTTFHCSPSFQNGQGPSQLLAYQYWMVGSRCSLKYTRKLIDAIHDGSLAKSEFENFDVFNLSIPKTLPDVPDTVLNPAKAWKNTSSFEADRKKLATMFNDAFKKYEKEVSQDVREAGPQI
ncbi:hypothetical protein PSHT_03339 [Puccinia striiformis]|uniref:Phosphoenolpyruvate carboxykinase (ATP) n=1 Tax=Puccinia striiformis TaxID=27350 RepID=A0A2S4WFQ3_9BASI|nr:hypothetical protein PSHT_03339 [Puccinia striiformis]